MSRDPLGAIAWASGKQFANPLRETLHELGIDVGAAFRFTLSPPGSRLSIVQTLGLGLLERLFFDE